MDKVTVASINSYLQSFSDIGIVLSLGTSFALPSEGIQIHKESNNCLDYKGQRGPSRGLVTLGVQGSMDRFVREYVRRALVKFGMSIVAQQITAVDDKQGALVITSVSLARRTVTLSTLSSPHPKPRRRKPPTLFPCKRWNP